jgi:hypothetical protein
VFSDSLLGLAKLKAGYLGMECGLVALHGGRGGSYSNMLDFAVRYKELWNFHYRIFLRP